MGSADAITESPEVRQFLGRGSVPAAKHRDCLTRMARLPGRVGPIIVLPDLSFKEEHPFPSGAVTCFRDCFVPNIIAAGINCGVAFAATDLCADDIGRPDWLRVLTTLQAKSRQYCDLSPSLPLDTFLRSMVAPRRVCAELGYSPAEASRIEPNGYRLCAPPVGNEVFSAIPPFALRGTRLSLGMLGGGNHFIEFQRVDEIVLPEIAKRLGLVEGAVTLAIHCSSPLGPLVSRMYSHRRQERSLRSLKLSLRKVQFHLGMPAGAAGLVKSLIPPAALKTDDPLGRLYAAAYDAAAASSYVHRALLIMDVKQILADEFGASCELVVDLSHDGIWRERVGTEELLVHRHGACVLRPGHELPTGHAFAEFGQPTFLGTSMYTPSGLFVPGDNAHLSHYSISHGTGRLHPMQAQEAESVFSHIQREGPVTLFSGPDELRRQLRYTHACLEDATTALERADIARLVAKLTPVASYKDG